MIINASTLESIKFSTSFSILAGSPLASAYLNLRSGCELTNLFIESCKYVGYLSARLYMETPTIIDLAKMIGVKKRVKIKTHIFFNIVYPPFMNRCLGEQQERTKSSFPLSLIKKLFLVFRLVFLFFIRRYKFKRNPFYGWNLFAFRSKICHFSSSHTLTGSRLEHSGI